MNRLRSAILRNIPDDQLENALGAYVEGGWRLVQLVPASTATQTFTDAAGDVRGTNTVTHWHVVMELS